MKAFLFAVLFLASVSASVSAQASGYVSGNTPSGKIMSAASFDAAVGSELADDFRILELCSEKIGVRSGFYVAVRTRVVAACGATPPSFEVRDSRARLIGFKSEGAAIVRSYAKCENDVWFADLKTEVSSGQTATAEKNVSALENECTFLKN